MATGLSALTESDRSIGEELAEWGKVALLETTGRITGTPVRNAVGFVEDADGNMVVAAGSESADWALNLRFHPDVQATVGDRVGSYHAEEIDGPDRSNGLTALVLKYGTPAEKLGHGPVFRLAPDSAAEH